MNKNLKITAGERLKVPSLSFAPQNDWIAATCPFLIQQTFFYAIQKEQCNSAEGK